MECGLATVGSVCVCVCVCVCVYLVGFVVAGMRLSTTSSWELACGSLAAVISIILIRLGGSKLGRFGFSLGCA